MGLRWIAERSGKKSLQTAGFSLSLIFALAVGGAGIWKGVTAARTQVRDLRLIAPVALIEAAKKNGGRIFSSPSMLWEMAALSPESLGSTPMTIRAAMVSSPVRWRDEDRENPSSAVIIAGRVAEASPLIEHLLSSPDWRLAQVDNHGLLFLRGKGPNFSPPATENLGVGISPDQRPYFLARTALNYQQADLKTAARSLMDNALDAAPGDSRVLVCGASLAASQGQWERARALAEKSLKADPESQTGAYLLALSLLETGVPVRALDLAGDLIRTSPRDPSLLLLHARAARAARDPTSEINSLEKLVSVLESNGYPTTKVQIYLGQAWAQKGFPDQALKAYRAALAGDLTAGEASDVREAVKTIEENRLPSSR